MSFAAEMTELCPGVEEFVLQNNKGFKYVHKKFPGGEHGEDDVLTPPDLNRLQSKFQHEEMENRKISTNLSLVEFRLYSPESALEFFTFYADTNPEELLKHGFDPKRNTKFIAHGWTSDGDFANEFQEGN